MNTRLHHLRKLLKLSQEDFGKPLGVTGASISRLENGTRNLTKQMILAICHDFLRMIGLAKNEACFSF